MSNVGFTAWCNTGLCIFGVYFVSEMTVGVDIYVHIQVVWNWKMNWSSGEYAQQINISLSTIYWNYQNQLFERSVTTSIFYRIEAGIS